MGIEPKVHLLGVDENLQDHSNVGISFESKNPTFDSFRDPHVIGAVIEYQNSKTGPLAFSTLSAAYHPCMELLGTKGA
jgi:choline dehydrogenase-like flavoprotein